MKNLFKQKPTEQVILKAIHSLGFETFTDFRAVHESSVNKLMIEELKVTLKEYYYSVFYKQYVEREYKYLKWVTVVRQLLRTAGLTLIRGEKCCRVEANIYQYRPFYRLHILQTDEKASDNIHSFLAHSTQPSSNTTSSQHTLSSSS